MTPILQILCVCEKPRMVQEEVLAYDLMKTFLYVRLYNTRMHYSRMRTTRSSGSVCLSACWVIPPGVWAWRPPQARPLNFPPGCGPGDLQGMLGYHPPPRPAAKHAGIPPAMHSGIPTPPVNRITDTYRNITLPQLRCGR